MGPNTPTSQEDREVKAGKNEFQAYAAQCLAPTCDQEGFFRVLENVYEFTLSKLIGERNPEILDSLQLYFIGLVSAKYPNELIYMAMESLLVRIGQALVERLPPAEATKAELPNIAIKTKERVGETTGT